MTTTEVLKRKCTSLFTKEDRKIILNVVEQIHGFMSDATHLLKAYYLHTFEKTEKGFEITENILAICYDIVSGKRTSIAQRTIKDKEDDLKNAIEMEKDDEVKKTLETKLKREQAKKINRELEKDHFTHILELYQSLGVNPPKDKVEQFSVSHILNYSFNTLLVAYKNNIIMHFQKYVQKYIYCTLLASGETGKVKYMAKQITNNLLYNDVDELNLGSVLLPENVYKSRTNDIEKQPWAYLGKMVWMNKRFEDSFDEVKPNARKLYCPISLITTQIPAYIRLDTSGIAQLLMTKKKIEDFVICYEKNNQSKKLEIKNKADLCSSYSKLTGIMNPSDFEKADFASQLWKFICKFDTYKKIVENKRSDGTVWVFDNAIMTDGYVCSFQITQKENLKRKVRFQKKKEEVIEEEVKEEVIEEVNLDKIFLDENKFKILGNDPGKSDISFMTDGKKKCLRYTKKQRDQDTHKKQLEARSTKLRKNNIVVGTFGELVNPSIHDFECIYMSETLKKSCHLEQFLEYWKRRREFSKSCKIYNHPFFRQAKFVKYCKTKSSEMKYFNKVKETFGEKNKEIVIGWGNWGRNPNLKGSAPTPGIGFRRKAEQHFKTRTVQEHFTSKTCPCCENRTLTNPEVGKENIRKHHLLRCTNGDCKCRWWNRNVVGSFNILKRFKDSLSALSEIKSLIEIKNLNLDNTVQQ